MYADTIQNATPLKREIIAKQHEIARRYAWRARQARRGTPSDIRLITLVRLRELERVFQSRYGRHLPDDDAGRDDLAIAAHHVAHLGGDVADHIVAWARMWAPWMAPEEAGELAERVMAKPIRWKADTLAWRLGLTDRERTELGVTTIGAIDVNQAARAERRKEKKREANRARYARNRQKAGKPAITRTAYEATSAARTKPWNACNMSRSAWYAAGKPDPGQVSTQQGDEPIGGARPVHAAEPPPPEIDAARTQAAPAEDPKRAGRAPLQERALPTVTVGNDHDDEPDPWDQLGMTEPEFDAMWAEYRQRAACPIVYMIGAVRPDARAVKGARRQ
jgi:hypothetical protein